MATKKVKADPVVGELDSLLSDFQAVMKAAADASAAEDTTAGKLGQLSEEAKRGTDQLHTALDSVYTFGKILEAKAPDVQKQFVESLKAEDGKPLKWTASYKRNIYIALTRAAFSTTAKSLRSKYSSVLLFAASKQVRQGELRSWLREDITIDERGQPRSAAGIVARLKQARQEAEPDLKRIKKREETEIAKRKKLTADVMSGFSQDGVHLNLSPGLHLLPVYYDKEKAVLYVNPHLRLDDDQLRRLVAKVHLDA